MFFVGNWANPLSGSSYLEMFAGKSRLPHPHPHPLRCKQVASQHMRTVKSPEMVLCPELLGPKASPFLFSEVVTLEQWSETFLFHRNTVQRQSYLQLQAPGLQDKGQSPPHCCFLNNILETLSGLNPVHRPIGNFSGCDDF